MFRWNTKRIVAYLSTIPEIEKVDVQDPGGDVDTENLYCKVRGLDEGIFVCGFTPDVYDIDDPSDCEVELIEITDQSGHGLQSDDFAVAKAYIEVRQHFVGGGATVVPYLKDYF